MKLLQTAGPALVFLLIFLLASPAFAGFVNFESPQVHPVDLSPDGRFLAVCNTADNRLEVFDARFGNALPLMSVPVGYDPVSVRFLSNTAAWVVNQISDSVSIVDVSTGIVVRTILTKDEPADVVFAGAPLKAYVSCSQANLIQVYNAASPGAPIAQIVIEGEDPRALAVSNDGTKVFAAIFESGNKSTILGGGADGFIGFPPNVVNDPSGPYGGTNPPPNAGAGFDPPINPVLPAPPKVGLIVKKDGAGNWMDDNGGNWTGFVSGANAANSGRPVGWDVLDNDVAVIDTSTNTVSSYAKGLMNICMAIAVNPVSGEVGVVGTDATNEIRFEPNLKGTFLRVNLGRFAPATPGVVTLGDLNPHLTYAASTVPQVDRDNSIGDPRGIKWNAAGTRAYVTGMGSNNLVVINALGNRAGLADTVEVGEGPTGLAIDEINRRIYVLNRFEGSVSIVDLDLETELSRVAFFDPTPAAIKTGRKHLFDTHKNSGLGQIACASCHVDARMDRLAWDLGDPSGGLLDIIAATVGGAVAGPDEIVINRGANVPFLNGGMDTEFHPMKGPMTTQTFQDIIGKEPHHWRGDRDGIEKFAPAFMDLQGDDTTLTLAEMQEFENYLASIHFPPNPFRNLDNTLPSNLPLPGHFATGDFGQAEGTLLPNGNARRALTQVYRPAIRQIDGGACINCHALPSAIGTDHLETSGNIFAPVFAPIPAGPLGERHHALVSIDGSTQDAIKVPQTRNMYDKVGFFSSPNPSAGGAPHVSRAGFGYLHDGSVDSLARFFGEPAFAFNNDQEIADMVALMLAFTGSDFNNPVYAYAPDPLEPPGTVSQDAHAAVGQQVTLTNNSMVSAEFVRMTSFLVLADAGKVDVIVKATISGVPRGWVYLGIDNFQIDEAGIMESKTALVNRASPATPVTFTVVPEGCGDRFGIDREDDGLLDHDEIRDFFPLIPGHQNPFNPRLADASGDNGSLAPDGIADALNDFDGDGTDNGTELANGTNPAENLAGTVPATMSLTMNPGGSVTVDWTAVPAGVYQVQYTDDLVLWRDSPTGQFIAPPAGGPLQWTDNGPPDTISHPSSLTMRFYRVLRIL